MKHLHLSDGKGFLPDSALEDVTAIVGRRGRGKTNTATVLVEEAHAAGMRFCFVDPVGVAWGLRSSRDGKAAGIPVVVMGGEHAMVPLEPTSGKIVADFLASPGPSVVLDFRLMRKGEMTRFMTDFLERLYFKNREPLMVVLDEADKFAPQRPFGEEARLLGAAEDLVKMGRARGLHAVLITQRPATLSKNVLTQAGVLIAHGLPAPQDQKAVDAWIREREDEEHRAEFLSTLAGLERGEAWVWAPEEDVFRRVQIRERETFDSSATPKRGERRVAPKVLAEVDLAKLSEEIKATVERAKADDPKELRKTIAGLRTELAKKPAAAAAPAPIKIPALTDAQVERLTAALHRAAEDAAKIIAKADAATSVVKEAFDHLLGKHREVLDKARAVLAVVESKPAPAPVSLRPIARVTARPVPSPPTNGDAPELGNTGARRMMVALAQYPEGMTGTKLSILTGISQGGGTWRTYLSQLRGAGWVFGGSAHLSITDAGRNVLGAYEPLPVGPDLVHYWRTRLGDSGKRRIFDTVVAAYPKALTYREVAEATGIKEGGGTWRTYLSELRGLELIVGRGELRASETFFS